MTTEDIVELIKDGWGGYYRCPYCGQIFADPEMCCGEFHSELIHLDSAND